MIEGIIFAVILIVVIPVGFVLSTTIVAALVGLLLKNDAEQRNQGSELIDTNY